MGAVYQAMDENLNCVVAVKETFAKTEEHRRAFRREAELLANLNHPTLPKVMDHFTQGEEQFLVMQFVSGHDLAELLELREQPFAVEKVLGWAEQLLDALEELHSYEPPIIHRDLKPSNLKVTPKGRVVLLDFGLAKGAAGQMSTADIESQPKSIYGYTPNYAPLEQIRGAGTDPRSDLYSLGATMWSLLTGKVPPDALSRVADKEEGKPDPLIRAHELNPDVPLSASEAISHAMNLNRNQRPASAVEMRKELRGVRQTETERQTPQTQTPPAKISFPEGASTAETMKMSGAPHVSTRPDQPAQTMPFPKPPAISSHSPVVGPTVASLSPAEVSTQGRRAAIIGVGVAVVAAGILLVMVVAIFLAILRPWSKNSNVLTANGNNPGNTTKSTNSGKASNSSSGTPARSVTAQYGIEMVWITPGSFMMGRDDLLTKPIHRVTIGNGFYLGRYEVTQAQWQAVMGSNPSRFTGCGGGCPVEMVSWSDAQAFIRKLNQTSSGYTYRLPTEAEWEYACRAGTTGDYYVSSGGLREAAWFEDNSESRTHPVGLKLPNAWGLYDMSGNVWEWVEDPVHYNYDGAPTDGRAWTEQRSSSNYVIRGGAYFNTSEYLFCPPCLAYLRHS